MHLMTLLLATKAIGKNILGILPIVRDQGSGLRATDIDPETYRKCIRRLAAMLGATTDKPIEIGRVSLFGRRVVLVASNSIVQAIGTDSEGKAIVLVTANVEEGHHDVITRTIALLVRQAFDALEERDCTCNSTTCVCGRSRSGCCKNGSTDNGGQR